MSDPLRLNEIPSSGPMEGCVVTLHGRGVTGEDLMPLAPEIGLNGIRWIFPDAPFPFPSDVGGREFEFKFRGHHTKFRGHHT